MIKKLSLISVIFLGSTIVHAGDCLLLNERVNKKAVDIIPRCSLAVKSKQRVYFHTAPDVSCKIKGLFIIHGNRVTAYDLYKDASQQEWISVLYYSERQDLDSEIVEGWMRLKDFD